MIIYLVLALINLYKAKGIIKDNTPLTGLTLGVLVVFILFFVPLITRCNDRTAGEKFDIFGGNRRNFIRILNYIGMICVITGFFGILFSVFWVIGNKELTDKLVPLLGAAITFTSGYLGFIGKPSEERGGVTKFTDCGRIAIIMAFIGVVISVTSSWEESEDNKKLRENVGVITDRVIKTGEKIQEVLEQAKALDSNLRYVLQPRLDTFSKKADIIKDTIASFDDEMKNLNNVLANMNDGLDSIYKKSDILEKTVFKDIARASSVNTGLKTLNDDTKILKNNIASVGRSVKTLSVFVKKNDKRNKEQLENIRNDIQKIKVPSEDDLQKWITEATQQGKKAPQDSTVKNP